jgi:predicted acylesterase/phospholipase RssA
MPDHDLPQLGVSILGGGVTGAMYSVGVLAALEDQLEGFRATELDAYVGAGTGAVLAVGLAGGLSAQRLYRALLNPADDLFPMKRHHLLRLEKRELRRAFGATLRAARRLVGTVTRHPLDLDLWHEVDRFFDALPAGVLTMDAFERFLNTVLDRRGIPTTLDAFERPVRIVANDLDAGTRVVFGEAPHTTVFAARAMVASCAAPVLFAPVEHEGRDYIGSNAGEMGHVDVAAHLGCRHVLILNPQVPIRVSPDSDRAQRLRQRGLLWVYSQSWRMVTEARLLQGLERFGAAHPEVALHLVEPDRDNTSMFTHSPMNFAARREILEDAYRRTTHALREPGHPLRAALEAAGRTVRADT